jgi:GH15 family glucan-1,4-alpha-glucosidase
MDDAGRGDGRVVSPQAIAPPRWADYPSPIADYALIGDGQTAALVDKRGSIDWLCWPRFDSPACFAALLGTRENGFWRVAPEIPPLRVTRHYWPDTMVLETLFDTAAGTVALIDFMAIGGNRLIRIVEGRQGSVPMLANIIPCFDYGRIDATITEQDDGRILHATAGTDSVTLTSDGPKATGVFVVAAGQRARFTLSYGDASPAAPPTSDDIDAALTETAEHWREWSQINLYRGRYRGPVHRSVLTLKALFHTETGGMVAAPTTSLPEHPGGERNWDYRFCWPRDTSLSVQTLLRCGYRAEAGTWDAWLSHHLDPKTLQTLYRLDGERTVIEQEIPWLIGYRSAKPVRTGNAASEQLQIDVFGELLNVMLPNTPYPPAPDPDTWTLARNLVLHLETIWTEPDESIWEVRGDRQHFTFSKVMAWAAFDRAITAAETFGLDAPLDRWRAVREEIHTLVCGQGFNKERNSFTQVLGGDTVDASLLLIPTVGFLSANDPRMIGTTAAISEDLLHGGLVRRYLTHETDDGLDSEEGVFLACSFWLVDVLAMQNEVTAAKSLFESLLALCNDVGLLSEEYDPVTKNFLGNFPQAFSHLALVNSAMSLQALGL